MRFAPISIILSVILVAAVWPRTEVVRYDQRAAGLNVLALGQDGLDGVQQTSSNPPAEARGNGENVPWLHVEVETKYAWIYQKSIGRAYTTVSQDDTTRVPVGQICIELEAHGKHTTCETNASYVEVTDIKRRVACKKKTAYVSAWTQAPAIKKTTVKMEP